MPRRKDAGRYELALHITAKNAPDGLGHYEGAFALRDWNRIFFGVNAHEIKLRPIQILDRNGDPTGQTQYRPFSLRAYFDQKNPVTLDDGFVVNDFRFSRMYFQYQGVESALDYNMDRVVSYQLRVCVSDPMDPNTKVLNKKFRVYKMQNPDFVEQEIIRYENERRRILNQQIARQNRD
ncbi:MAG: hypothetical protein R2827_02825 [Bdellovibrionales bacterium]